MWQKNGKNRSLWTLKGNSLRICWNSIHIPFKDRPIIIYSHKKRAISENKMKQRKLSTYFCIYCRRHKMQSINEKEDEDEAKTTQKRG
jgi:hypothetical protein